MVEVLLEMSAWDLADFVSANPFVLEDIPLNTKGKETLLGVMSTNRGQRYLEVFTFKNHRNRLLGEDITRIEEEFNAKNMEEIEQLKSWYKTGYIGAITLLVRENGPLATLGALALEKKDLSALEAGIRFEEFQKLEKTARNCAEQVHELYLNLMRDKLYQGYAKQLEISSFNPKINPFIPTREEDKKDPILWTFDRLGSSLSSFSTLELANKLEAIGFDFTEEKTPLFLARLVRNDLVKTVKSIEQQDRRVVVSEQQILKSIIKISAENRIKPKPSELSSDSPFMQKLYECKEMNDYPLSMLLDWMHVGR